MVEVKTVKISQELYNRYCKTYSHYYDPIEVYPKNKEHIAFFAACGKEGKELAQLAKEHILKIYP